MSFIKNFLLALGTFHAVLYAAGALGVGNYYVYYSVDQVECK